MYCRKCGENVRDDSQFCYMCGSSMGEGAGNKTQIAVAVQERVQAVVEPKSYEKAGQWWICRYSDRQTYGPIDQVTLEAWIREKRLNYLDYIREQGMNQWIQLYQSPTYSRYFNMDPNKGLDWWHWFILIPLSPLAGWIGWGMWRATQPKKARQAATIAWVMLFVNIAIRIISAAAAA